MKQKHISITAIKNPFHIDLLLKFCGYQEKFPCDHRYGEAISGDYIFQYCTRGKGELIVEGDVFKVEKGDCMLTLPGQTRVEKADSRDPWGLMWIGINGKSAQNFFQKLDISLNSPVLRNFENTNAPYLMKKIIDIADSVGFERNFLLAKSLFAFFDEIVELCNVTRNSSVMADNYVAQTAYYMDMHYSEKNLSVDLLAKNIGLNRSYLYKIFKERTGLSPQEYLSKVRIEKALEFMELQHASVTTIANSVGYEPSVFSKAFKKAFGISPKEYIAKEISAK